MKIKKPFLIFYILLSHLFMADVVMVQKLKTSLAGNWSDWILFDIWLLSTFAFLIVFLKKYMGKIYLILLISVLALTLPVWVFVFAFSDFEGKEIAKSADGNFRIELMHSFLQHPRLQVVERMNVLERVIAEDYLAVLINKNLKIGYESISDVRFIKETPDSLMLEIHTPWRTNLLSFKKGNE